MTIKPPSNFLQSAWARVKRDLSQEIYAAFLISSSNKRFLLVLLGVLIGWVIYLSPFPPKTVYLVGAETGTANAILGEKLQSALSAFGVDLVPVNRSNKEQYANALTENPENVIALYVAGGEEPKDNRTHVSLGSVQYSPLWLFYRGKIRPTEGGLPNKMSIGPNGSSTQKIFLELEESHRIKHNPDRYLKLEHEAAAAALLSKKIDAMFLVDGYDSPLVQKMIHSPEINVFSYDLADAYDKRIPHINKVVVPRGLFNTNPVEPVKNLDLLTTTVTLLVDQKLHPVIQWAVLKSARDISLERKQVFADPGFFPVYLDRTYPLSTVAAQYYQGGMPSLFGKLPLSLSVLLDRVWFELLAVFALLIPIWALLPFARQYYFETVIQAAYLDFQEIDNRIKSANSKEALENILEDLLALDRDSGNIWYSTNNLRYYYVLKFTHIRNMVIDVKAALANFN